MCTSWATWSGDIGTQETACYGLEPLVHLGQYCQFRLGVALQAIVLHITFHLLWGLNLRPSDSKQVLLSRNYGPWLF